MTARPAHTRTVPTEPEGAAARSPSDLRAELEALRDIGRALSGAQDVQTTLQAISRTTAEVMHVDSCSIYLLDTAQNRLILKASTGLAPTAVDRASLELGEGITGYAADHGEPVAVRDAAADRRFKFLPETRERRFKSLLAVPLISQRKTIGAMNVQTTAYHDFSEPEIALVSLIGELAAGALERAELHDRTQRQLAEMSALARVSRAVTGSLYLEEMLAIVVEMAAQIMGARACALLLYEPESDVLVMRAAHGLSRAHAEQGPLRVRESLTGRVVTSGKPVAVRDVRREPQYRNRDLAERDGLRAFLAVPLTVRDRVIGTFNCYMGAVHGFTQNEIELFTTFANQTALAIENANLAMNALLVREMHHRIKNNLQMVAMLLRLQLQAGGDVSPRAALQQTINRIMGIAAVHEALSHEGFRLIDVKALLEQAAQVATQNLLRPGQRVRVQVEGDSVRMPSQPATTIAIVANELIHNSIEHGFASRDAGAVRIGLRDEPDCVRLLVSDDGDGLPAGFDPSSSLGLQIVSALVTEDLRGEFSLENNPDGGATARVVLPRQTLLAAESSV